MAAKTTGSTNIRSVKVTKGPDQRPDFAVPEGFDSIPDFLSHMRKEFYNDIEYDRLNRDSAYEDLQFVAGNQWNDAVRLRREAARKPTLTVNRLPAFIAQVIGARRMNETTVKVLPDNGGTQAIASIREGLIRSIIKLSKGQNAFDKAYEGSVMCGIGNFQVELDYASEEVFDQVIKYSPINDHMAVIWDRMMQDGTGKDAGHCYVVDTMKMGSFRKKWPWATAADIVVDTVMRGDLRMNGWISVDDVRVVSYWRMLSRKRTIALLLDGSVKDITDIDVNNDPDNVLSNIAQRTNGSPVTREVDKKYAQMYLCSGTDILEGPYELPISRVPVFRVPGWEINISEWKHRWGITRFLKDPQRLHNFWRSVYAEKLMQTPRGVWTASDAAVAGREQEWRNSHLSDDPLLIWNSESGAKPERIPPAQIENALSSQAEMSSQDMKDVSNIHEANLGMPSNEVSGAAIVARQRVSDTGTVIYQDNLEAAIEESAIVVNQLISVAYDTPRTVKILGKDGSESLTEINSPQNPDSPDLSIGLYSVTAATAPTTATKRIESADSIMTFVNAAPSVAAYTMDLVAEAMDWPGHEEIARRIRMTLPPGMVSPDDMTPEMQQAQQQKQSEQATQTQMMMHQAIAQYMNVQSQTAMNNAKAENYATESQLAPAKLAVQQTNAASQSADRELRGSLETVRVADGH